MSEYIDALEEAIAAILNLPHYRSDMGDLAYQSGVAEGREQAVAAIRALISDERDGGEEIP